MKIAKSLAKAVVKASLGLAIGLAACVFSGTLFAQTPEKPKRNLLFIGQAKGYQHESISTAMATLFRGFDGFDLSRGASLSAEQSHGAELSHAASVALAGGRAVGLDSHGELSNEQPRLRDRVAFGAAVFVHENRSADCFAQLRSIPALAGTHFQRVHTPGGEGQGGVELDVAAADGLQFSAPGRQRWE